MIDYRELPDDGVRFEQVVRELLIRDEFNVRWTGVGPDGGRDLLVIENAPGPLAPFERTWVVSCKHFAHSGKSVGTNDLDRSIIDTCKSVGASGFLLACSTQISSGLGTRFREIEQANGIVCRAWDGVEIEKRLMEPRAFSLVSIFFPKAAVGIPWSVYNAGSPSFWCGSHGGHLFYMSSRLPAGVPKLPDVERMLQMLNAIPLKTVSEFGERERLRLRAANFDNKNENYLVFVDYLIPTAHDGEVLAQSQTAKSLLEQLNDGNGLYSDEVGSWYRTNWDILRIKTFQLGDHFDEDHKDYYTSYIANFECGLPREGAASAFDWGFSSWKD
jgi:hypothetical protein